MSQNKAASQADIQDRTRHVTLLMCANRAQENARMPPTPFRYENQITTPATCLCYCGPTLLRVNSSSYGRCPLSFEDQGVEVIYPSKITRLPLHPSTKTMWSILPLWNGGEGARVGIGLYMIVKGALHFLPCSLFMLNYTWTQKQYLNTWRFNWKGEEVHHHGGYHIQSWFKRSLSVSFQCSSQKMSQDWIGGKKKKKRDIPKIKKWVQPTEQFTLYNLKTTPLSDTFKFHSSITQTCDFFSLTVIKKKKNK